MTIRSLITFPSSVMSQERWDVKLNGTQNYDGMEFLHLQMSSS